MHTLAEIHRYTDAQDELNWFQYEGDTLFSASDDGEVRVYDMRTQRQQHELQSHSSGVYFLQFDKRYTLMTGSTDCTLKVLFE